jgi:2-polyprenyl-6-methoxyphenol hydroxylase-like FAD-dependent oxidoreductase
VWFVPQWRTEEILRARLRGYGVEVELATEVTAIEQDLEGEQDAVTVHLQSGENVCVRYLVGADGGRSAVRRGLGIPFLGATDDEVRMLLADVRVDGLDHEYGHGWMLDNRCFFGFTPLAGGADSFVLNTMAPEVESTLTGLQATLEAVSGRTDIRLRELTWATVWRSNVRLAQQFRSRAVFLAGDAAHVHPPTGGQGLNTGVQDAYNLGWKLATALSGLAGGRRDCDALLDSYQAERLPIASRVLGISTELLDKTLRSSDDTLQRGEQTQQLDLGYRAGPLALDDSCGAVLAAGDRAPDAPCLRANGERARLFTLFAGPHWTLLRFGSGARTWTTEGCARIKSARTCSTLIATSRGPTRSAGTRPSSSDRTATSVPSQRGKPPSRLTATACCPMNMAATGAKCPEPSRVAVAATSRTILAAALA